MALKHILVSTTSSTVGYIQFSCHRSGHYGLAMEPLTRKNVEGYIGAPEKWFVYVEEVCHECDCVRLGYYPEIAQLEQTQRDLGARPPRGQNLLTLKETMDMGYGGYRIRHRGRVLTVIT